MDFDDNHTWGPQLTDAIGDLLSTEAVETISKAAPKYVEEAYDLLFSCTNREKIVKATLTWIRSIKVVGYHGSRLINSEVASIRTCGLLPLDAAARRPRLVKVLSYHPRWNQVANYLDSALQKNGPAGHREGQVHLTLSWNGLVKGFNHYLTFGSEFDQRVVQDLVGVDGKELLGSSCPLITNRLI